MLHKEPSVIIKLPTVVLAMKHHYTSLNFINICQSLILFMSSK